MNTLFVVERSQDWPFEIPRGSAISARRFVAEAGAGPQARVVNLCRTGRYQGRGYYVSLLAEARGQRPLPDVKTVEDLKSEEHVQAIGEKLATLADETLRHDESDLFELDAYFGRDPAGLHEPLAQQLFAQVRAPLLRARFQRQAEGWRLQKLEAIGLADVTAQHRPALLEAAKAFAADTDVPPAPRSADAPPRLAILWDPDELHKCSNEQAIRHFVEAAPLVGLQAEVIGLQDIERLDGFDGLFIRAGADVGGLTYEFARRAEALGMPVVDDPESMLRCLNKVYMRELLERHQLPQPRTLTVHRGNLDQVLPLLGLPCVLKLPDSGFGLDVLKIESEDDLKTTAERFFKVSELIIAQEWLPTGFDWRIGVYDRRPLFVAQYFMAPGHWKVNQVAEGQKLIEGKTVALSVGEAPEIVVSTAVKAANLIGRGLYGVDLKQVGERCYVIEVNCNPNVDAGNEDQVLGTALYREILAVYARRIRERRASA